MDKKINQLLKTILELDDLNDGRLAKLKNSKYLVVLDMGCGSTSATVLDLEGYKANGGKDIKEFFMPVLWDYRSPPMAAGGRWINSTGEPSVPTLIGYKPDSSAIVGPEALATGNACENFKERPTAGKLDQCVLSIPHHNAPPVDKHRNEVWADYFREIAELICARCYQAGGGPGNRRAMAADTLFMVAHPAGKEWEELLGSYRALISSGTGLPDENILTISEAKAAMQYVRRKKEKEVQFDTGVVIIDIGASTIDIEYLATGQEAPIEFSLTMAGREADALLLHFVMKCLSPKVMEDYPAPNQLPEDDEFFMEQFGETKALAKFLARSRKEGISDIGRIAQNHAKQVNCGPGGQDVFVTPDMLCGLLGDEGMNDPLAGAVFGDQSFEASYPLHIATALKAQAGAGQAPGNKIRATWYGHLENLVRYMMDYLAEEDHKVANVIVTGGSCRLLGIQPHIRAAIQSSQMCQSGKVNIDRLEITYLDSVSDYENSVPYGGGYYVGGLLGHLTELENFPKTLRNQLWAELRDNAAAEITNAVDTLMQKINKETLQWWAKLPEKNEKSSTYELGRKLDSRCSRAFDTAGGELDKAIEAAIRKVSLPNTIEEINKLLDNLAETKFTGTIDVGAIHEQIKLPHGIITRTVKKVDVNALKVGILSAMMGGMQNAGNAIKNLFGKGVPENRIQRNQGYREAAYNKYVQTLPSTAVDRASLRKALSDTLDQEFRRTDICGIPDNIVGALTADIIQALYMN